ncbi:hypothetical protein [Burkholderia glumae]|uniref:hypothetical protein n=1 Tax=Burkholderia glumae TaxID=337 RepID=UPI003B99C609
MLQIYCLTLVEDKGDATGFSLELPDRVITLTHRGGDMDLEKPKGRQSGKIRFIADYRGMRRGF